MCATTGLHTSSSLLAVCVAVASLSWLNVATTPRDFTDPYRILSHRQTLPVVRATWLVLIAVLHAERFSIALVHAGQIDLTLVLVGASAVTADS